MSSNIEQKYIERPQLRSVVEGIIAPLQAEASERNNKVNESILTLCEQIRNQCGQTLPNEVTWDEFMPIFDSWLRLAEKLKGTAKQKKGILDKLLHLGKSVRENMKMGKLPSTNEIPVASFSINKSSVADSASYAVSGSKAGDVATDATSVQFTAGTTSFSIDLSPGASANITIKSTEGSKKESNPAIKESISNLENTLRDPRVSALLGRRCTFSPTAQFAEALKDQPALILTKEDATYAIKETGRKLAPGQVVFNVMNNVTNKPQFVYGPISWAKNY